MSLFKWSTPERRRGARILPIIPNEVYFCIFEHVAPPTGRPTPEQLKTFTNLSLVCKFFANFYLPRIFEFVEFLGSIFRDDTPTGLRNDALYKTSRESTLCTQIAAKQPLALALAKTVRVCYFTDWKLEDTGSWAVRLFANKYIAGMLHMKNIREIRFAVSFVDAEHWNAIATLGSLEELSFDRCKFLQGPADVEPGKRVRVKVSSLRVVECDGLRQLIAAIDARSLRTLAIDSSFFDHVDWLSQSTLTELRVIIRRGPTVNWYMQGLHAILMQARQSLGALSLLVDVPFGLAEDVVRSTFEDPVWKNLHLLRSLTLFVHFLNTDTPTSILSSVLEGIGLLPNLQSFTLEDNRFSMEISPTEVRRILHDKLGPASSLECVDIYGGVLRLVNGEWSPVPSRMA